MATLTPTLTLTSSDLSADENLSLSVSDSLTVNGQYNSRSVEVTTTSAAVFTASLYTKAYVFMQNHSTVDAEIITIEKADSGDEYFFLAPGEFAFFPWASTVDLFADAATGTPSLEVRVFEVAIS